MSSRDWFDVARVRVGRRPVHRTPEGRLFSPSLLPVLADPRVQALGHEAEEQLLGDALRRYLHFTIVLETEVVGRTLLDLAHQRAPTPVSDQARREAFSLHCDESWHAVLAVDLLDQLGLHCDDLGPPAFLTRLNRLTLASADPASLMYLLFSIASETLISNSLRILSADPFLKPVIREFVEEHAREEAHHSAYFRTRSADLWQALDPCDRDRIGPIWPSLIHAYLEPDTEAWVADLVRAGLASTDAHSVVTDTLACSSTGAFRSAARPTLTALESANALRGPTREAFVKADLLDA